MGQVIGNAGMLGTGDLPLLFHRLVKNAADFLRLAESGVGCRDLAPIAVDFLPGHLTLVLSLAHKHLVELKDRMLLVGPEIIHVSPGGKPLDPINMNGLPTEPGPCAHVPVPHHRTDGRLVVGRPVGLPGVFPSIGVVPVFVNRLGLDGIAHGPGGHHILVPHGRPEKKRPRPGTDCLGGRLLVVAVIPA